MVWYAHVFQNFPVCGDPHSQRLFMVTKAEIDVFLELFCFFHDPADFGNLISRSSASSEISLNILEVHGSRIAEAWLGEF